MDIKELEKIVWELNKEVFDIDENHINLFSFGSTGTVEYVMYGNEMLWNSEDDTWDRESPLISHIKRKFNEYVDELMAIYFIEN